MRNCVSTENDKYSVKKEDLFDKISKENDMVILARNGDPNAISLLFKKYSKTIKSIASNYFFPGYSREDVIQEGRFGLYKAIRDYRPERAFSFKHFVRLCVARQIKATVKKTSGTKHKPLNYYVSLNKYVYDDEECATTLGDLIPSESIYEPNTYLLYKELFKNLKEIICKKLSKFERKVIKLHIKSNSYEGIADILGCEVKSVDNAIQRARKKIKNTFVLLN